MFWMVLISQLCIFKICVKYLEMPYVNKVILKETMRIPLSKEKPCLAYTKKYELFRIKNMKKYSH